MQRSQSIHMLSAVYGDTLVPGPLRDTRDAGEERLCERIHPLPALFCRPVSALLRGHKNEQITLNNILE